MNTIDLKSDMPTTLIAGKRLANALKFHKNTDKVIKILHGYGSSGVGGAIKQMVHKSLNEKVRNQEIKAYIPGEAISHTLGFDEVIVKFKHLIVNDSDFKRDNYGITYVIL
jgi:glutathione synthase/RimK-type ligase-like ATP-grasp enzyme